MTKEYSPFTPGVPVPLEFFVGREREVSEIVNRVSKSVALNTLERLFISGERGIGKSSLCSAALRISEEKHEVLGLHVHLGGVKTLEGMAQRVFDRILQESRDRSWYQSVRSFMGNHIKEVGLFGITLNFDVPQKDLTQLVNNFAETLRNLQKNIADSRKGLLIVLDDLNGLASTEEFANWLKSLVDEIATSRNPVPLTLVLVGMPDRRMELIRNQPSLDRVFDIVHVTRFNESETNDFFRRSFEKVGVEITQKALQIQWKYSGGYPVFLHEIGDAVFKIDSDNRVDDEDAILGIVSAARVIGEKYIAPNVLQTIWSKRYHGILSKFVPDLQASQFSKSTLLERLSEEEAKSLNNFLQKMKQLGVIQQEPGMGRGQYKFSSELYTVFFWLYSQTLVKPQANIN